MASYHTHDYITQCCDHSTWGPRRGWQSSCHLAGPYALRCLLFCTVQCLADVWSVTYNISFWKDSYFEQAGVCDPNSPSRPAACDLDIPFEEFTLDAYYDDLYPDVFTTCPFNGFETLPFRAAFCECLKNKDLSEDEVNTYASSLNAFLGFNLTLVSAAPLPDVEPPAPCSSATFVPPRNLFVCDAEGVAANSTDACTCQKGAPFYLWGNNERRKNPASSGCFEFVAAVAQGGQCLAITITAAASEFESSIGKCRISTCPCPEFLENGGIGGGDKVRADG